MLQCFVKTVQGYCTGLHQQQSPYLFTATENFTGLVINTQTKKMELKIQFMTS